MENNGTDGKLINIMLKIILIILAIILIVGLIFISHANFTGGKVELITKETELLSI
jgi:hypothetical protein